MALTALFIGTTGLAASSSALDVAGSNLANANTTGFKSQRPLFKDLVYQTLNAGSGVSNQHGGTNPSQLGFGVGIGLIDSVFLQGPLTPTGRELDFGLQGKGFFVVGDGSTTYYTRDGAFNVDTEGYLVDPNTGFYVQRFGNVGEPSGATPGFQTVGDLNIRIPFGAGIPGNPTTTVALQGNLSAAMQINEPLSMAIQVYDTQNTSRALTITFTKTAPNTFTPTATISGGTVTVGGGPVTFDQNGLLVNPPSLSFTFNGLPGPQTVNVTIGTPGTTTGMTQFGGTSTATAVSQDGNSFGSLNSIIIDQGGVINGVFSNGRTLALAQLAIAGFNNEAGLLRDGNNYFSSSTSSGPALIGVAGAGGRGTVQSGALEESNVDIAEEFTRLIIAQRGFQINARVITAGNELLQELATIIR
jgi:flagellar hook protein FlgE